MEKACEKGITLIEVLVVVAILGIAASVAFPAYSSLDEMQLELVAQDLRRAIRFARSEAIRTGISHGVSIDESDTRFRLYKYDSGVDFDVYNPLNKLPYVMYFGINEYPVSIESKSIKFQNLSLNYQGYITFSGSRGIPVSNSVGTANLLEYASIELGYDGKKLDISIAPISGRVTLQ